MLRSWFDSKRSDFEYGILCTAGNHDEAPDDEATKLRDTYTKEVVVKRLSLGLAKRILEMRNGSVAKLCSCFANDAHQTHKTSAAVSLHGKEEKIKRTTRGGASRSHQ